MDCRKLLQIIKKGEDSKTQFKVKIDSVNGLTAEIGAFANTEGGRIIIGVSDNGEIVGIDDINTLNQ
jgi:ATP-dependent DNA helicase RecG